MPLISINFNFTTLVMCASEVQSLQTCTQHLKSHYSDQKGLKILNFGLKSPRKNAHHIPIVMKILNYHLFTCIQGMPYGFYF